VLRSDRKQKRRGESGKEGEKGEKKGTPYPLTFYCRRTLSARKHIKKKKKKKKKEETGIADGLAVVTNPG